MTATACSRVTGGKSFEKFAKRIARAQMIKQMLDRHARAGEAGLTVHSARD